MSITYTPTISDLDRFVQTRNAVAAALDLAHLGGFDPITGASNPATRGSYSVVSDALIELDERGKAWFGAATYIEAVGIATRDVTIAPPDTKRDDLRAYLKRNGMSPNYRLDETTDEIIALVR